MCVCVHGMCAYVCTCTLGTSDTRATQNTELKFNCVDVSIGLFKRAHSSLPPVRVHTPDTSRPRLGVPEAPSEPSVTRTHTHHSLGIPEHRAYPSVHEQTHNDYLGVPEAPSEPRAASSMTSATARVSRDTEQPEWTPQHLGVKCIGSPVPSDDPKQTERTGPGHARGCFPHVIHMQGLRSHNLFTNTTNYSQITEFGNKFTQRIASSCRQKGAFGRENGGSCPPL